MKILQVLSSYLPEDSAGTQLHVRDLCAGLRKLGHETEVFAGLSGKDFEEFELSRSEWEGVPVTRVTNNYRDVDRFELLYASPRIDARFGAFLDEAKPDLVHVHHLTGLATSILELVSERGLPLVMTLHDYWLLCPRGQRLHPDTQEICETLDRSRCVPCLSKLWPLYLPYDRPRNRREARRSHDRMFLRGGAIHSLTRWETHVRRVVALCDVVIAPSAFHRDRFVEWGLDPGRCFVVPHGLPRDELQGEPRGARPVENIGFIGTVIPSKGVHTLVEAFALLHRDDLVLHIHGNEPIFHGDTDYGTRLRAGVRAGLDVRFHGAYEHRDLPAILACLDLLVVPALWWETFCLTVREGVLAGLPVVASRLGGITEAVDQGMALGFEAGNAKDLARVLRQLLEDDALRDRMSRRADLVRDMSSCVEETEKLYQVALEHGAWQASSEV
ncbi:MAG: glycosyltransferase family 4 protein [Planctomycetota bacterium]